MVSISLERQASSPVQEKNSSIGPDGAQSFHLRHGVKPSNFQLMRGNDALLKPVDYCWKRGEKGKKAFSENMTPGLWPLELINREGKGSWIYSLFCR